MKLFFAVWIARSALLDLWLLGGTCWKRTGGFWDLKDKKRHRVREGGKEIESGAEGVNIGGRSARFHGYIANVPMVRKDKEVFASLVRRDREPTCEIGRCPLVPKDREDLGRI